MKITPPLGFLYNRITSDAGYEVLRRYGLIENAVINYAGGITFLESRVRTLLVRSEKLKIKFLNSSVNITSNSNLKDLLLMSNEVNDEVVLVLKDVNAYLRDINYILTENPL